MNEYGYMGGNFTRNSWNVDVSHVYESQDQVSYIFKIFVNILKILCKQIWLRAK